MSERAEINCCTAWVNVHLAAAEIQAGDVVLDLLKGARLRALLQSLTGSAPKRLDTLDGLTANQKVMRVDWFADALKASKRLASGYKVDSKMISLQSAEHLLPLLYYLMDDDITLIYEKAPCFMKRGYLQAILAEPLLFGPCTIAKDAAQTKSFYTTSKGKPLTQHLQRRRPVDMTAQQCVFSVANRLLKTTTEGQRLIIKKEEDLVDSRVLCALVNALVPMTFPTEVLANDRWTINLVLKSFSEIVGVQSLINSEDLHEGTNRSSTALLAFVLMSGLQYSQAAAVVERMDILHQQEMLCGQMEEGGSDMGQESNLETIREEICWIQETYNHSRCREWTEQAKRIQAKVGEKVDAMLHCRFSQVTVPRPMTINKLTAGLVINLGLTGGSGFYLADSKESLWPNRRLVVQDKKTGGYFEDFSGYDNHRGTVRDILGLHPYDIVEVNPSQHPDHLLFFESPSRNRILKANTRFLYQVFPGTSAQCKRQLLRAARIGELDTVKKLLVFFKRDKQFVNGRDTETGNTALHFASRQGHLEVMQTLLESEAEVDPVNNAGSTPFFLATEGLHKTASLLLLEWGANIRVKNRLSKTALDLTRNTDLRAFLTKKYMEYQELQVAIVRRSDCGVLERHIDKHLEGTDPMASLNSRCVRGGTLLHAAASIGSLAAVKKLLSLEVKPDIRDTLGATPLHITRDPAILQEMLEYDGDVNSVDGRGNSPLHCLCSESRVIPSLPDCVSLLVGRGASLGLKNDVDQLPIHCAAAFGVTSVIDSLLSCGAAVGFSQNDLQQLLDESTLSSLPYLAITGNHLHCSQWLVEKGFLFMAEELDELLVKLLSGQTSLVSELKEALRFLVEQGADVNVTCKKGSRPLHLAAALSDHPDLVEVLLEAGADPNIPNSATVTPLIIACQKNNLFSARTLLQRGASCTMKDSGGKCAFEYISDYEEWIQSDLFSPDIVSQLREYKLRQGKELVVSLSKQLNSSTHHKTSF